jgi:hypothetical protein
LAKGKAVVFGFTGNMTFAVSCVMMDLRRHCLGRFDEVVCLHDGAITPRDMERMRRILPVRFIRYECPMADLSRMHQGTLGYFSHMVFSKYECLRLLEEYSMVVFLDYDIVLTGPLDDVFASTPGGVKMLLDGTVRTQLHPEHRAIAIPGIDMDGSGMCASLFVLEDTLPHRDMLRYVYEVTEEYAPYLYGPEQFGFSMMLQRFGIADVVRLEGEDLSLHPREIGKNPRARILHAYGQPKFWNGQGNPQWDANYGEWIRMGGSRYRGRTLLDRIRGKLARILGRTKA